MDSVICEHKLVDSGLEHNGKITKCGALMGQGPGWTVLCILNDFAANYNNHMDESAYQICGDDLIGLWT